MISFIGGLILLSINKKTRFIIYNILFYIYYL